MSTQVLIIPSAQAAEVTAKAALEIVINSPESKQTGEEMIVAVDRAVKNLDADEEALKRPHLDALDSIRAATKPYKTLLVTRRGELSKKLLMYDDYCDKEAARKQALENAKYERKVERLEQKAEQEGKPLPIIPPPPVITPQPKTSYTASGATISKRITKDWRLPVVTSNGSVVPLQPDTLTYADVLRYQLQIPPEYFKLDTSAVGRIIRAHGHIQGIEDFEVKGHAISK